MQVQFIGCRIEKMEQYNGKFYTVVGVPAPDAYSHPSRYRLQSQSQIGQYGQLVDVVANMQGIVKTKSFVDRQTNQSKQFDETTVLFDIVSVAPHSVPNQSSIPAGVDVKK